MKTIIRFMLILSALAAGFSCGEAPAAAVSTVGVWADTDCELLRTERYALLFERGDSLLTTALCRTDSERAILLGRAVFGRDSIVERYIAGEDDPQPFDAGSVQADGTLRIEIGGRTHTLTRIEHLEAVMSYEMLHASPLEIGSCIQQWSLGIRLDRTPEQIAFEAGTNRHSYCFYITPGMVYCRAARIRSNDRGTLFAQNIRLMSNAREHTAHMAADNLSESAAPLRIDDAKFSPDRCVFADEGIYWSFLRFEGDTAVMNGCGEIYRFGRPAEGDLDEWFAFKKY